MNNIISCATVANNNPCTLADLVITANNFTQYAIMYFYPLLLIIAVAYTVIKLLININKPEAIVEAKKNFYYIVWGSIFILGAWGIMRFALALLGWGGSLDNIVMNVVNGVAYVILSPVTAYAAPLNNPLNNPDVRVMIASIISYLVVAVSIVVACTYVYVGYMFIANSDNPDKLKSAKKTFMVVSIVAFLFFSLKGLSTVLMDTFANIFPNQAPTVRRPNNSNSPSNTTGTTPVPAPNDNKVLDPMSGGNSADDYIGR